MFFDNHYREDTKDTDTFKIWQNLEVRRHHEQNTKDMLSKADFFANIFVSSMCNVRISLTNLQKDTLDHAEKVEQIELLHFKDIQIYRLAEYAWQSSENDYNKQNHVSREEF